MARKNTDPCHLGTWPTSAHPNGEPQSVRDAYDALLTAQREQAKNTATNARNR